MFLPMLIVLASVAGAKPADKTVKPLIWTSGYYNSVKGVFSPKQYDFMDRQSETRDLHEQGFLLPSERDAIFRKLDLETKLGQLDDLDKDLLLASVRYYTVAELHKQYPMLTLKQLSRLKVEVEKVK